MFLQSWGDVFSQSLQELWIGFLQFTPDLLLAIIFFLVGWVVGGGIGHYVERGLNKLKLNQACKRLDLDTLVSRAGYQLDAARFVGQVARWFIIIVFLMSSLEILGLTKVNTFLQELVVTYLPQVIIAAFVLVAASVLADVLRNIVYAGVKAAGVRTAKLLSSLAFYAVWIFAFVIALSELGIGSQFMQILFTGIVAMLALAGGLAFGLGGRDAAAKTIEKVTDELRNE